MDYKQYPKYALERIKELGLKEEENKLTFQFPYARKDGNWLEPDSRGNLRINYLMLEKEGNSYLPILYRGNNKVFDEHIGKYKVVDDPYYTLRLARPKGDKKYDNPTGQPAHPFLTRVVVDAYAEKRKLKALVLVEGALKALKGSLHGLPCIGLSGIWGMRSKGEQDFHPWILEVIKRCKTENLVYLHDGDARSCSYAYMKDLYQRPRNFADTVRAFQQAGKRMGKDRPNLYYAHLLEELEQKGLDDVLIAQREREEEVINDLLSFSAAGKFFASHSIGDWSKSKIYEYFFIDSAQRFYDQHSEKITDSVFVFNEDWYEVDPNEEEVRCILRGIVTNYLYVSNKSFKIIYENNSKGFPEPVRDPRGLDTIKREMKRAGLKGNDLEEALLKIPTYEGFANEPDFLDYKKEIVVKERYRYLNLSYPVPHQPEEGEWPSIQGFLRHIFANKGDDKFEVGLDMIQLYYTRPKQKQRILSLVSKENETGKSTFLQLLREMFGQNMSIIGNAEFQSQFNPWITKSILGIDESRIGTDSISMIKSLVTNNYVRLNDKNVPAKDIINYSKLVMTTNDIFDFANIGEQENKWFVVEVSPITKRDAELPQKMFAEIPAFLHFLLHRNLRYYTTQSRFAIPDEVVRTEALGRLKQSSKPILQRLVEDYVAGIFKEFEFPNDEFRIDAKRLHEEIFDGRSDYRFTKHDLAAVLKNNMNMEPSQKTLWMSVPRLEAREDVQEPQAGVFVDANGKEVDPFETVWRRGAGKCYVFRKEEFVL